MSAAVKAQKLPECFLTFTFESLSDEPPQHLPAVIAEGRRLVGVNVQSVRSDLEVLLCGESWNRNTHTQSDYDCLCGKLSTRTRRRWSTNTMMLGLRARAYQNYNLTNEFTARNGHTYTNCQGLASLSGVTKLESLTWNSCTLKYYLSEVTQDFKYASKEKRKVLKSGWIVNFLHFALQPNTQKHIFIECLVCIFNL